MDIITARIRRMGKVMFSLCVSVHTWGVPHPADWGGHPLSRSGLGGVPQPAEGVPHSADRGVPHSADRGYPGRGYHPHSWVPPSRGTPLVGYSPGRGTPQAGVPPSRGTPPTRPAQHVLATWQAVCLLRSRKRIFLLI